MTAWACRYTYIDVLPPEQGKNLDFARHLHDHQAVITTIAIAPHEDQKCPHSRLCQ